MSRPESKRGGGRLRVHFGLLWAGMFVLGGLAWAVAWEPAHDEGVTWTQVFGAPEVSDCAVGATPIGALVEGLEGGGYGLSDLGDALRRDGMHPPLYYARLQASSRWLGTERPGLVLFGLALGVLGLFAMGRVSRELAPGPSSAGLGMALLALSPWFLGYSVFLRPYALAVVVSLFSTWAVLEAGGAVCARRRIGATLAFVLASILGLYTVYHYAFVVAWHVLALAGLAAADRGQGWRRARELGVAVAAIGLAFLPWLSVALAHLALTSDSNFYFAGLPPVAEWPTDTGHLLLVFLLGEGMWSAWGDALILAAALAGAVTLPLIVASFVSGSRWAGLQPPARWLWYASPVVPVLLVATDIFRDTRTAWISKSGFALFPLLLLLLARAAQGVRGRFPRAGVVAVWPVLFALASGAAIWSSVKTHTGHEVLVRAIALEDRSSHQVVVSSTARGYLLPFLLDARKAGLRNVEVSRASPETVPGCIDDLMANDSISRVTLVDFGVVYRPEESWGALPVEAFQRQPDRAGWDFRILQPGDPRLATATQLERRLEKFQSSVDSGRRLLLLSTPSKVKYFSE